MFLHLIEVLLKRYHLSSRGDGGVIEGPEAPEEVDNKDGSGDHPEDTPPVKSTEAEVGVDKGGNKDNNGEVEGNILIATVEEEPEGNSEEDGNEDEDTEEDQAGSVVGVHEGVGGNPGGDTENSEEESTGEGSAAVELSPPVSSSNGLVASSDNPGNNNGSNNGCEQKDGEDILLETTSNVVNSVAGSTRSAGKSR